MTNVENSNRIEAGYLLSNTSLSAEKDGESYIIFDALTMDNMPEYLHEDAVYSEAIELVEKTLGAGIKPYFVVDKKYIKTLMKQGLKPGSDLGNSIVSSKGSEILNLRLNVDLKNIGENDVVVVVKNPESFVFQPKIVSKDGKARFYGAVSLKRKLNPEDLLVFEARDFSKEVEERESGEEGAFTRDIRLETGKDVAHLMGETVPISREDSSVQNLYDRVLAETQEIKPKETDEMEGRVNTIVFQLSGALEDSVLQRYDFGILDTYEEKIYDLILFPDEYFDVSGFTGKQFVQVRVLLEEKIEPLKMFARHCKLLTARARGINLNTNSDFDVDLAGLSGKEASLLYGIVSSDKKVDKVFLEEVLALKKELQEEGFKYSYDYIKRFLNYYLDKVRGLV
ncbi:MAG: hypothetical protein RBS56_01095 [Candidatus Gracilibacteria bacterium]|jgi:hypothetical protein|nr:hypothetical protein [Candidatus Gracilibacteria bacterium]